MYKTKNISKFSQLVNRIKKKEHETLRNKLTRSEISQCFLRFKEKSFIRYFINEYSIMAVIRNWMERGPKKGESHTCTDKNLEGRTKIPLGLLTTIQKRKQRERGSKFDQKLFNDFSIIRVIFQHWVFTKK